MEAHVSAGDWKSFVASDAMVAFKAEGAQRALDADEHCGGITTKVRAAKHDWPFEAVAATCRKLLDTYLAFPSNRLGRLPPHSPISAFCLAPLSR